MAFYNFHVNSKSHTCSFIVIFSIQEFKRFEYLFPLFFFYTYSIGQLLKEHALFLLKTVAEGERNLKVYALSQGMNAGLAYQSVLQLRFFTIVAKHIARLKAKPIIPEWIPLTLLQPNATKTSVTASPTTRPVITVRALNDLL